MLAPEEENEAEVRREDQDRINRFARLNAKLHEIRSEIDDIKKSLELLDDASTELMMGSGDNVLLSFVSGASESNSFFDTCEDDAIQFCEKQVETLQLKIEQLNENKEIIINEQNSLKVLLYNRFGKSINLEE